MLNNLLFRSIKLPFREDVETSQKERFQLLPALLDKALYNQWQCLFYILHFGLKFQFITPPFLIITTRLSEQTWKSTKNGLYMTPFFRTDPLFCTTKFENMAMFRAGFLLLYFYWN